MKKPSENYQIISVLFVAFLVAAMIGLSIANLSHAFAISGAGGGSPDAGYVIDGSGGND